MASAPRNEECCCRRHAHSEKLSRNENKGLPEAPTSTRRAIDTVPVLEEHEDGGERMKNNVNDRGSCKWDNPAVALIAGGIGQTQVPLRVSGTRDVIYQMIQFIALLFVAVVSAIIIIDVCSVSTLWPDRIDKVPSVKMCIFIISRHAFNTHALATFMRRGRWHARAKRPQEEHY